jgi:ABC-type transport system involved in multi-copper enzyme maturation permease subunit
MSTWTIARLTFREASRRKILLAALALGIVFVAIFSTGFHFIIQDIRSSIRPTASLEFNEVCNFLIMAGLYVVNFLTVMMAVLTSVDTISGEIASGTVHTLVAKPIHRWEIVTGKWIGFAGMLTLYQVLMAGGVIASVYLQAGYLPPNSATALPLLWLNALLLLSVSLFGGTVFSTLANGVMVFGLFGIAFLGGWIEQFGTFLTNASASQTAVNIGVITSLLLPSEALWRRAAYEMQSPLVAAVGFSPFFSTSVPSIAMIVYAVIYLIAAYLLAIRQFNRRDL